MTHVCVRWGRESRRTFRRTLAESCRAFGTRHDSAELLRKVRLHYIVMIEGSVWQGSAAVAALCQRHAEREGVVMIEELKKGFLGANRPCDRSLQPVLARDASRRVDLAQQQGESVEQASNRLPHNARC